MSDEEFNDEDFIFDVNSENFNSLVLDNSEQGPVLVHFWSRNSGPGFSQYPVFEKLIRAYSGSFLLVNLDTDEHRKICKNYSITSIPTLKLFVDREVVETLFGYQKDQDLRFVLDQYAASEKAFIIREALTQFSEGNKESAYQMLGRAALEAPHYYKIPLTIASLMQSENKHEQALKLLDSLPQAIQQKSLTQRLKVEIEFAWISEPVKQADQLKTFIENHPDELPAKAMLAAWHTTQKEYASALELFHQIMLHDRDFESDLGRRSIVKTLTLLQQDNALIPYYRNLIRSMNN